MLLTEAYQRYIDEYARDYYKPAELDPHEFNLGTWRCFARDVDANDVTPPLFVAWRDAIIKGGLRGYRRWVGPRCRTTVNRNHKAFMRAFTWMCMQGIVTPDTHYKLKLISKLKPGRSAAKEPVGVVPATEEQFWAVYNALKTESAKELIRLVRLSGMRPKEACQLCSEDIAKDIEPGVWFYSPKEHKTQYMGRGRFVAFGPECQEIIRRFEAKKRLEPGPLFRNDRGQPWTRRNIQQRIWRACHKAGLPPFALSQLRKTRSNEVFDKYGLQGESATLGHSPETARKHYLMRDMKLAAQIAREIG